MAKPHKGLLFGVTAGLFLALTGPHPAPVRYTMHTWSSLATRVCSHVLLFEHPHDSGTRAGALAVARDIRNSTRRRLAQLRPLGLAPRQRRRVARWLAMEQRLADMYARDYVRIFEVIDSIKTARQRAREAVILMRLVHAPDRLRAAAARLGERLRVPDCTGGGR